MRKLIGFVAGLLLPAVALAGVDLSNQLKLGDKTATDKKIVFDKGSGASNPQLKWNNSTSKIQFANDGTNFKDLGSGAGGINLIANGDAEDGSVTGWTTYDDGGAFVDGTGGAVTATFTNVSATPLRDTKSFLFTSGTGGEGACYTFTVQPSDQARMLRFTGEYSIASGTYPTDDLQLWIYDVTNGAAIQPAPYKLTSIASGVTSNFMAEFQTSATGTSYRACFHQGTTATYTVKLDTLSVGPTPKILGTPVTDRKSYTPDLTSAGGGNITLNATGKTDPTGVYFRVGDTAFVQFSFANGSGGAASGAAGDVWISLPAGLTPDISKMVPSTAGYRVDGTAQYRTPGTTTPCSAYINGSNISLMKPSTNDYFKVADLAAATTMSGFIAVPIVGWSSSTVMSEGAATRVIAADYSRNSAQTIVGNGTDQTVVLDTVKSADGVSLNTSTGIVTIQVPGTYRVSYAMYFSTGATATSQVYMGIVPTPNDDYLGLFRTTDLTASKNYTASGTGIYKANAGSTLRLVAYSATQDITVNGAADRRVGITVERISGPDQIAASESVTTQCIANASSASAVASYYTSGATKQIDFNSCTNTHSGVVTTGTSWKYSPPAPGVYLISTSTVINQVGNWSAGDLIRTSLYKNGNPFKVLDAYRIQATNSELWYLQGSALVTLAVGDYIDTRLFHNGSSAHALYDISSPQSNYIDIVKVGN